MGKVADKLIARNREAAQTKVADRERELDAFAIGAMRGITPLIRGMRTPSPVELSKAPVDPGYFRSKKNGAN